MSMHEPGENGVCLELEQDLVLLHYGELIGAQRQRVQAHVNDCAACRQSLAALAELLPKTVLADEPPAAFWQSYSRELHHKLMNASEREPWWRRLLMTFEPWAIPALATSLVLALALTFTLEKTPWREPEAPPPADDALLEVLPMAENLDFFRNLDTLDDMEFLDQIGQPSAT
jgi:hypothetical protein